MISTCPGRDEGRQKGDGEAGKTGAKFFAGRAAIWGGWVNHDSMNTAPSHWGLALVGLSLPLKWDLLGHFSRSSVQLSILCFLTLHQGQIISQIHQLAEPMRRPARDLVLSPAVLQSRIIESALARLCVEGSRRDILSISMA